MNRLQLIALLLVLYVSSAHPQEPNHLTRLESEDFDVAGVIARVDIYRTFLPDTSILSLYQGNGRFVHLHRPLGPHLV